MSSSGAESTGAGGVHQHVHAAEKIGELVDHIRGVWEV